MTEVLVDTSVWVKALAGREPLRSGLDALLASDVVVAHELIYGELLIGDPGGMRGPKLALINQMTYARTVPHHEVEALVRSRRLHGRGIGWIDAHLLASALVERIALWTADEDLNEVAAEMGVAYAP